MGCQAIRRETSTDLHELLGDVAEDIPGAFDELITEIEEQVVRTAFFLTRNIQDAEDVSQEVYVRLVRNREQLARFSNFRGWVYTVTINAARDQLRRRRLWMPLEMVRSWIRDADSVEAAQFQDRLTGALGELSFRQRAVFVLKELHDLSSREVAEVLGCSETTVRGHLMSARKRLQKQFGEFVP